MTIHRFYVPDVALEAGRRVELPEAEARHAVRVLRLKPGSDLVLFDGRGASCRAVLRGKSKRGAVVEILGPEASAPESRLDLALAFGLSKGSKPDLTIQKAVELGARLVVAVEGGRSIVRLDGARAASRIEHWHGVAVEACKQCERAVVPELAGPVPLADLGPAVGEREVVVLEARGSYPPLAKLLTERTWEGGLCLAVGPEGGWSPEELELAGRHGWLFARLGQRILRAETACIAALAITQSAVGDLGA